MISFGEHPVDADLHAHLVDTADELIRLTGADLCEWNRAIEVHGMKDDRGRAAALGKAHWEGTISLREDVLTTLRDLWQRSPGPWSNEDRERQQPSVLTVAHELIHYLVPAGERYTNGKRIYEEFPGRALEEGLTELAGRKHAHAFAGAEVRSPGVTDTRNASSYPQFVPAAQAIVQYVSELHGDSEDAVLNVLARENVPGKFRRLSQMVLEANGTWNQIPVAERAAACAPIINSVWGVFQSNAEWASRRPEERPTRAPGERSWIMGLQLVGAVERARLHAVDRYGPERVATPVPIAAARYERYLARKAVDFAQSSRHADVRAAAGAWMQRAIQRTREASTELEPERPEPGQGTHHAAPEVAAVPSLAESPRPTRTRRPRQVSVRRRPGRPDRGLDR